MSMKVIPQQFLFFLALLHVNCSNTFQMTERRQAIRRIVETPFLTAGFVSTPESAAALPWGKEPLQKLDEKEAARYKNIVNARDKMKTQEEKDNYKRAVCKSGVLGPSFLSWVFCS